MMQNVYKDYLKNNPIVKSKYKYKILTEQQNELPHPSAAHHRFGWVSDEPSKGKAQSIPMI